jgi:hypothetical protein
VAKKNQKESVSFDTPKPSPESLISYQKSLRNKLGILSRCFSLILIVIGLYLLVSGLFGIVNKNPKSTDNAAIPESDNMTVVNNRTGRIDDGGLFVARVEAQSGNALVKAVDTAQEIAKSNKWRATDYEKGDIGIGNYHVKLGDTLWEIAEAVYGDGAKWTKILKDNKEHIGFLPDGEQALIWPDQVLVINRFL